MHGAIIGNAQSQGSLHDLNPVHLSEANAPTQTPAGFWTVISYCAD